MAKSLTKSSASLVAAGGNLAEAAALTATANAIIQDADSVGTALKTTSLRLRGTSVKILEEEGLDTDGAVESTSKLRSQVLATSGVDILTDTGAYKSTYQILLEIAEVWDKITDDKARAGLLELLAGKRNSSVIAALLQNPEDLKAAYEDAMNAEGSALEENERYLDSIQGKIDQFNNAMQSMWSNTLDSDVVKWFVSIGTELIKIVDTIGLIPSILTAILAYKLAVGTIKMFDLTSLGTYISMLFTANSVTEVHGLLINKTALAQKLLNSTLIQAQAARMGLTAADLAGYSVTQLLTLGVKGLAAGFKNLWIAMGPVGWAILAIVGSATAFTLIFNAAHKTTEELAEELSNLKSELQDIDSEIDNLNSELKTTQDRMAELLALPSLSFVEQEELATLKQTTAELERQLKLKELFAGSKEDAITSASEKYIDQAWNSKNADKTYAISNGIIKEDGFWDIGVNTKDALNQAMSAYEISNDVYNTMSDALANWDNLSDYDKYALTVKAKPGVAGDLVEEENWVKAAHFNQIASRKDVEKYLQDAENHMIDIAEGINMVFSDENFDDLEYGMSEDIDAFLDEIYAYQLKWQQTQGAYVKADAISSMFDATSTKEMQEFGKALQGIADSDLTDEEKNAKILEQLDSVDGVLGDGVNKIKGTTDAYNRLHLAMNTVGVTAQDIADYFVLETEDYNSNTVEGILNQYKTAKTALENLKSGSINLDDLVKYDEKNGEATGRVDAIAEQLKGVSPEVREQFTSIVEAIKEGSYATEDGLVNWDSAIKKLELQGMQAVIAHVRTELEVANKLAFPDLEVSGWIDSVDELSDAFENLASAMDLIVTAQEQMDNSGRISMKTALGLMETTDNWNEILEVNNGVITMNAKAEQILIQSKLDLIKANIEMALQEVETQIALAEGAINSTKAGNAFTQGFTKALTNAQGVLVGLKAGWDAFWAGTDVSDAFNNAYKSTVDNLTPDEASLGELYEQRAKLEKQRDMIGSVDTTQEFKNNYDFDKTPGDKYGEDEDSKTDEQMDAFQKEMDYWENRIGANKAKYEQLQNEIDLLEAKGQKADASYYEEQVQLEGQRLTLLEDQKTAALEYLGTLEEGSEEWWEVANVLNGLESDIDDVTASIVDLQDAIGEIDTYKFEEFNSRLDDITSKLGTIRDLIAPDGEEDWFDDQGQWTEEGVAVLGTYIQELETYKQGLAEAEDAYVNYVKEYVGNEKYYAELGIHSEQELYDKRQELIEQQYDYAQSISDTKQSVVDMYESNIDAVEEYTETLIDSYNDYIDSVKEALDAERDLYDFKKNVQKQSKDIAAIERRIASLSGSTNASDVAERRKLEAQLYESRESLNDTYYDHARSAQDEALDAEQTAYEETMNKFIEGLRIGLESATANMDEFLMSVTSMVTLNADTVLAKYQETELPLGDAITNPWKAAIVKIGEYDGDALELMNKWTQGGFFDDYKTGVSSDLSSPWSAGSTAASAFKTSVSTVMSNVVSNISTNVKTASDELSKLYQQIKDIEKMAAEVKVDVNEDPPYNPDPPQSPTPTPTTPQKTLTPKVQKYERPTEKRPTFKKVGDLWSGVGHTGVSIGKKSYNKALEIEGTDAIYYPYTNGNGYKGYIRKGEGYTVLSNGKMDIHSMKPLYQKYAKGTTGTTRDEWALTDEPQFGDELVLVPGKDGNLSFMRKGTGVVPADMTQKLFELAQIPTSDLMNKNLTAIVPNITKNDFKNEFNFESLVHVDTVDSDTLPKLEKMVDKKIDDFSKALNYSLKRFAR